MKHLISVWICLMMVAQTSWGASPLLKDEKKSCKDHGGQVLDNSATYVISRALCENHWTIWLSKGTNPETSVVLDKISLHPLAKSEKFDDSLYCYLQGHREARLVFFGIFDFSKTGTVKGGMGKLIEGYSPDLKKEKWAALTADLKSKVVCELESGE